MRPQHVSAYRLAEERLREMLLLQDIDRAHLDGKWERVDKTDEYLPYGTPRRTEVQQAEFDS